MSGMVFWDNARFSLAISPIGAGRFRAVGCSGRAAGLSVALGRELAQAITAHLSASLRCRSPSRHHHRPTASFAALRLRCFYHIAIRMRTRSDPSHGSQCASCSGRTRVLLSVSKPNRFRKSVAAKYDDLESVISRNSSMSRDNTSISAAVNSACDREGLCPSHENSLYSTTHSFQPVWR